MLDAVLDPDRTTVKQYAPMHLQVTVDRDFGVGSSFYDRDHGAVADGNVSVGSLRQGANVSADRVVDVVGWCVAHTLHPFASEPCGGHLILLV